MGHADPKSLSADHKSGQDDISAQPISISRGIDPTWKYDRGVLETYLRNIQTLPSHERMIKSITAVNAK